jgi:outer membrane immunogenic protein
MSKVRHTLASLALLGFGFLIIAPTASEAASPAFNWSGWYVSGNAGWGWRSTNNYPTDSYYTGLGANFSGAGYGGSSGGGTARHDGFSTAFGAGYNYQFGRGLIVGAEYEFLYADLQTDPTSATTSFTNGTGIFATGYTASGYDTVDGDSNRWYGIARARIGMPVLDRAWIYFTGGAAYRLHYASQASTITTYTYSFFGGTTSSTSVYSGYNTSHAWGWVAGLGAEYAVMDNLFLRAEWLHMDFGTAMYLDPVATALIGSPQLLQFKRSDDIVRLGVSYRFYGGSSYY